jgi:hypothetical protein
MGTAGTIASDRLLHQDGSQGRGRVSPGELGGSARALAGKLRTVPEKHGGEAILPDSYMGAQGFAHENSMSAQVIGLRGLQRVCRAGGRVPLGSPGPG